MGEPSMFEKRCRGEITVEEYVADLKRRARASVDEAKRRQADRQSASESNIARCAWRRYR